MNHNKYKNSQNKQAFTLVELIVVITILAILWTIAFISLQWYSRDARDSVRQSDIANIISSMSLYETKVWKFPEPTLWIQVTYSWWEVWTQWTIWDSVITNLAQLNEKPVDPLTENEYTYSRLNTKKEYEIAAVMEWWLTHNKRGLLPQANAAGTKIWTAYIKWDYNWVLAKVNTWSVDYILSVPTIISWDMTIKDIIALWQANKLVYNWAYNLPDSYRWSIFNVDWWWFVFNPTNPVVYTWSLKDLSEKWRLLRDFTINLQATYSWTSVENYGVMKDIMAVDVKADNTNILTTVWNILNNELWTTIDTTLKWWRAVDLYCDKEDIVIMSWSTVLQTWAWCNSTIWNSMDYSEWGVKVCWDFSGLGWTASGSLCYDWSYIKEIDFMNSLYSSWANSNWDYWIDNIWWQLYTWSNADWACTGWYKLASDDEWNTLEWHLWCTNLYDPPYNRCIWLWWKNHSSSTKENNLVVALQLPVSWYVTWGWFSYWRAWWNWTDDTYYWTSTESGSTDSYARFTSPAMPKINRRLRDKTWNHSVRCIKE